MRQTTGTEIPNEDWSDPAVEVTDAEIDHLFASQRWHEAALLLDANSTPDLAHQHKRNLARNLAALQVHRPDVYELLAAATCPARIPEPPESPESLGPSADSINEAARALSQLEPQWGPMSAVVLAGIADGHLMAHLGCNARLATGGAERSVVVIEPDIELLKSVLLVHDFSGADGPIVQQRFFWLVGPEWQQGFRRMVLEDPWAAAADLIVKQGHQSSAIAEGIRDVRSSAEEHARKLDEENRCYYNGLSAAMLTDLFGETKSRKPRVLLPASRFTTVLQYAYRDAAIAFRELGWDVTLISEPALHSRMSASTIRHYIAAIKPDLILLIDHLRYEYGGLFPPNLPIATWTQDHLTNLTCEQAGRSIGQRDFVWTTLSLMYSALYNYPRAQCVPVAKLVHVREHPARHVGRSRDLVYVSHASDEPQNLMNQIEELSASSGAASMLLPQCARTMLRRYEQGGYFSTIAEVGEVVDHAARDLNALLSPHDRYTALDLLFSKLNNILYRQQALEWAIDAAKTHDLRLVIYGNGWDDHPTFAPYAAGPIENGPALEEAMPNARIVLQIVPYYCLHQRLLEGLVAGGFFLVRRHPSDHLLPALSGFVHRHVPNDAANVEEARLSLDGVLLADFNRLIDACATVADFGARVDLVELVRVCQEAHVFTDDDHALPRLNDVSFGSCEELSERVACFVNSPELRGEVVMEQQQSIAARLSYRHGIERALERMREIVAAEFPDGAVAGA